MSILETFWNFVKISKACGAFDEESFAHFREVYIEDYEQLIQELPPERFEQAKLEVRKALFKQREIMKSEGYKSEFLKVFENPDLWISNFVDVAAFRQFLSYTIQEKLTLSFDSHLND